MQFEIFFLPWQYRITLSSSIIGENIFFFVNFFCLLVENAKLIMRQAKKSKNIIIKQSRQFMINITPTAKSSFNSRLWRFFLSWMQCGLLGRILGSWQDPGEAGGETRAVSPADFFFFFICLDVSFSHFQRSSTNTTSLTFVPVCQWILRKTVGHSWYQVATSPINP